jgi:hypothetical protein
VHSILRQNATFFPAFRRLSAHGAHTRGNYHRLKSGSWRVQVRRKGKYVNETFLRRKDAEEWGIDIERRVDRQEPTSTRQSRDVQLFGDLIALHRQDLKEVGKEIGRSKAASLIFLDERLGHLRLPELDRERLIKFGKARALEGAGPVTVAIDLGYIKTILSHAAAVHGVVVSTEPIDLARIALRRLGLVGKGDERDRRPTQDELDRIILAMEANVRQRLVVSSDLRLRRQCGKTKLPESNGATSTPAVECSSFEIERIPERRRATTSEFLCWMYQAMTHAKSLRSKDGSQIFAKAGFFLTTDVRSALHFGVNAAN